MFAAVVCMGLAISLSAEPTAPQELLVFVGTYTSATSKGIYVTQLKLADGSLSEPVLAVETTSPSFLALHPTGRFLFCVNEVGEFDGRKTGAISSFAIEPPSGKLSLLNQSSSEGAGPCHLVVDAQGKHVLAANYGGGSVACLPIQEDGKLGKATAFVQHAGSSVNPGRQEGPHAHSINLDPKNRFAIAADLGLDKLLIYRFDTAKGSLTANTPAFTTVAPGSGPRHFAFHPSGRFAYVINEMVMTVSAFAFDGEHGVLDMIQTISTLPPDAKGDDFSTAEVQVTPDGKFLYGSNRGHHSIVAYAVDAQTGKLTYVENEPTQGKTPRNFGIDPTGRYLLAANQSSDTIVVFRIDPQTGRLDPTGHQIRVPTPVCVKFLKRS